MGILSFSKSATLSGLDLSEFALLVFGIVLVIGLVGEYAKSDRWRKHVKKFEMMVILGVAGELIADGGVFLFSGHLQTIADAELAAVITQVGAANLSANRAADAADRANSSAQQANEQAVDAGLAAGRAKTLAVRAAVQAAKAHREAEVTLQRLAWRRISPTQHRHFVSILSPYKGSIVAFTRLVDPEAGEFADALLGVLRDSGWNWELNNVGIMPGAYGLLCSVNDTTPAGKALVLVLRALPPPVRIESDERLKGNAIARIVVGLKPPP
jgi:hypothetical protein